MTFNYQEEYPMADSAVGVKRGFGLIIVNHFYKIENLRREGSENEVRNLKRLFSSFGLDVRTCEELTQTQILLFISDISKNPALESHSVFMLAISSHGTKDGLLGVDNDISENDSLKGKTFKDIVSHHSIIRTFNSDNCPFLLGKPKVFIFNGCRGDEKECLYFSDAILHPPSILNQLFSTTSADFLLLFSCVDGYQSLRKGNIGSSFIDILTETWIQLETIPLENALPYVNRQLICNTNHFDHQLGKMIASCCTFHSTLRYSLKVPRTKFACNQIIQPFKGVGESSSSVAIQQAHSPLRYTLRWSCVNEGGGIKDLKRPRSMELSNEVLLYVADCVNNRIQVYHKDTQEHVKCYYNIDQPLYLYISPKFIYATSLAKIMKISISSGTISNEIEIGINIRGITLDNSNYIYISEKLSLHIRILNEDFLLMKRMRLETPFVQSPNDSITQISDIKYHEGELFVLFENSEYTVQTFTMTGNISKKLVSHDQVPLSRHFYVGSDIIIISDLNSMKIKVFSTINGSLIVEIDCNEGTGALTQPVGVAFDPLTSGIYIVDHAKKTNCLMCYTLLSNT